MSVRHVRFFLLVTLLAIPHTQAVAKEKPLGHTCMVPADRAWTDTGIDVRRGAPLHLEASGHARMVGRQVWAWMQHSDVDRTVGPEGTYVWPREEGGSTARHDGTFPLPARDDGPFPAFCLIGKIGAHGTPFYVGTAYDGRAAQSGRLWLGINDDRVEDNQGHFDVTMALIERPPATHPAPIIEAGRATGSPVANARVLLFYIDGLRPDVLRQMAEAGFLPHIKAVFLDGGIDATRAFTVFPSNTLIANGSLFTGLFSDRTGIKSQNQFERSSLKPKGQLSRWLPDGFMPQPTTRTINLLDKYAPENTHAFLEARGVSTLATRLGKAYKFTTLPIAPLNPPPLWFHVAINTLGPFNISNRIPARLDEINVRYAVEELIGDPDARVIAVWLPMVDKTCHFHGRGQFGPARRDVVLADRYFGQVLQRIREVGWERSTYFILVSDHGHVGGEVGVNRSCNLPRDWAYAQLGTNANVIGRHWMHPGVDPSRFMFFDNQGAGQAKLFLPYGSYFRGPWRRNRLYELTHYELRPTQGAVNLLESLTAFRPPEWTHGPGPIDLILVKLDPQRVLLYRDETRQAILHHETDTTGRETYRYEPVQHVAQSPDGEYHMQPAAPRADPLGYLQDGNFLAATGGAAWLAAAHTAQEWLTATADTRYPDAVVTMTKFFAWQPPMKDLEALRDPDLLVTAAPGWSLRSDDGEGTDHGSPLAESMRITLCLAGPHLRHGTLTAPQRIVNVVPTILEMLHWPYDASELDGQAIMGIYE